MIQMLPPKTVTQPGNASDAVSPDAADGTGSADSEILRLFAEDVAVTRETVETGRVRIAKVTRTREHNVDALLAQHKVYVETIPIGREIDAIPEVRDDGQTIIIPVVEEVIVLQRKLVLKEEIHVRRVRTDERYRETVELRHHEVEVVRLPAGAQAANHEMAANAEVNSTARVPSKKGK